MASAAAVGADAARSPMGNNLGEDDDVPGAITSGVYSKDEDIPGVNGEVPDEDDDDEELPSNPLRDQKRSRQTNGAVGEDEVDGVGDDDLFGDEGDEAEKPARRTLDDNELDSGDDLDREDRVGEETQGDQYITEEKTTMDLGYPQLSGPEPSDGEMYLLKVPDFMSIEPHAWDHTTFQPPLTEHHQYGNKANSDTFSAYKTALSTMRWRHSPSNPLQLQSNARILRWSDGSLTLQLASDPTTQYDIDGRAQAPPQRNPHKPTPTSIQGSGAKHDKRQDTYTYLFRPYEENGTMVATNRITAGLSIKQSASDEDDAIERLQASLAAAANASKVQDASGEIPIDQDPEQAKKKAEKAMQEIERNNKKARAAADREAARADRALGRHGLGRDRYGGLNASMLEDDDEEGGGRGRPSQNKKRAKPRRRRNSEYSEEEDFGHKRFTKEDEYDEEDDFVAPSDEEEVVDDDDDPDDGIRSPKRGREDDEEDAPGEEEEEDAAPQVARAKKRRVVDEDEE